ncbi:hypothetical protein P153DRAFT_344569 [Dothidotthia symphoricarpi CBS 119687]|uniref:Uncharacterized protein n=1 Tax=Dothidotthia symphoricarpi CBS 119687 TaxID=1392245 RepID=A0A6A6A8N8_9PLEO|nr:uncharacterized protein P153DRAFT_344569 [Dothidotthia symphoricarpi CBS 119687]KAF2127187.1 hypothetical protein P153DRAFT_344569 [Dothidotthia symphoricarpi CBS 119687]
MMLTSSFHTPPMSHYGAYTPPKSSPLSPLSGRSANATQRLFDFSMPSENKSPVPQRAFKPNPVIQTRDAATKRRRDMFFKRVQSSREDKKWEARGEQIQQLDFVKERRRWEAEKARQAPVEDGDVDEESWDDATSLPSNDALPHNPEMNEAEYMLAQEEYELQQLVASMEYEQETASQHFGSDDEDYDSIFMECATANHQLQQQSQLSSTNFHETDAMDMDMTDG